MTKHKTLPCASPAAAAASPPPPRSSPPPAAAPSPAATPKAASSSASASSLGLPGPAGVGPHVGEQRRAALEVGEVLDGAVLSHGVEGERTGLVELAHLEAGQAVPNLCDTTRKI